MSNPGTMSFGTAQRLPKAGRGGSPGPGHYLTPHGLGEQKESTRNTSPRPVFGTCTRDGMAKVYLDPELMKTYYGKESPPPGSYNLPGAVGRQAVSTRESAPAVRIGTGLRSLDYQIMRSKHMPGPGHYRTIGGVGKQPLSEKRMLPAYAFGRGTRDAITTKTFISREHEKTCFGANTPGPTTAKPYNGTGPQLLSTRQSSPGIGFGTGKRLKEYVETVPGPGAYYA